MINKRDPAEWLEEVEQTPENAPYIMRVLMARLKSLDDENERLRNAHLELKQRIDTRAHQTEVSELKRQIKALARMVETDFIPSNAAPVLIVWSKLGDLLALDLREHSAARPIELPATWQDDTHWRLAACSAQEEVLAVTNSGASAVFSVAELLQVSAQSRTWHHIPGLKLPRDQFIAFMVPVGKLPLSDGLITASAKGYARKLSRWALDQSFQSGNFGKGITDEWDALAYGKMALNPNANALLVTQGGMGSRFPIESLHPGPKPAIRMEQGETLAGLLLDDTPRQQVALIDSQGRAIRRAFESIPVGSMNTKGRGLVSTDSLVSAFLVDEADEIAVLVGGSTTPRVIRLDAARIPLADRTRAGVLVVTEGPVVAAKAVRVLKDEAK